MTDIVLGLYTSSEMMTPYMRTEVENLSINQWCPAFSTSVLWFDNVNLSIYPTCTYLLSLYN